MDSPVVMEGNVFRACVLAGQMWQLGATVSPGYVLEPLHG